MKKMFFLCVFFVSGCASLFHGTSETITVKSEEKGARIYLNDNYIGTDLATVSISKKKIKTATIKAEKNNCVTSTRNLEAEIDPSTFWGCFIDACIFTVGGIDYLSTGAFYRLSDKNYILSPNCQR